MADATFVMNAENMQIEQDKAADLAAIRDAQIANQQPAEPEAIQARDQVFAEEDNSSDPNLEAAALLAYYQMKVSDVSGRNKEKRKHGQRKEHEKMEESH